MGLSETLVLYCVAGTAVAGAVYLGGEMGRGWRCWFPLAAATAFWPLYLPILLSRPAKPTPPADRGEPDQMAQAIAQVDAELDTALSSLDGWAENVLSREKDRLVELRTALALQAARIREMDSLIAHTDLEAGQPAGGAAGFDPLVVDRRATSEQARRKNLERLREVRRRSHDDLMGTLAWIRELVSMIHLAKFTGAPAARAEELVAQIASAVEGVSAVTWQDGSTDHGDQEPADVSNPAA
ncbi:MAG TPA: hypothetical protein VG125_06215 [Pirellulales bacterium]|jgi:hypothetical protein|nr:hypothetical protein [Pirellulales bacterium]